MKTAIKPSAMMDASSSSRSSKILCQFRVTKLRSWRTGYARILVLYEQDFATLDPDTRKETNRWSYNSLVDYMTTESNTILIATVDDKLKFSCDDRPEKVLLALLRQQDASGQASQLQRLPIFGDCIRWKRNGIQQAVILQVQSFALTELDAASRTKLQSYLYSDISAISFPNDAPDTIVFRFRYAKVLVYTCPRRASLVQSVQEQMTRLGLEALPMEPSRGIQEWRRRSLDPGTVVLSTWSVTKDPSMRRPTAMPRELLVTNKSLVERDTGSMIVNIRTLQSIVALVLYDSSGLEVEFEHNNSSRKYQVRKHRDALVVSIIDVAPWVVVVSKNSTLSYRLASKESPNKLFSPVPVANYTLGRVQTISAHVYAVLSGDFSGNEAPDPQELLEYCQSIPESPHGIALLMACREFNLMETVVDFKLPVVAAVMGIAEAIIKLPEANRARREIYYEYVATLFYTAQRLLRCHPKMAADLASLRELVPLIFAIENDFCRYNGLLVLEAALTGKDERDLEAEYVNKNVFFQSCGQVLVGGIVACLEPGASDLILMVASNILQSILCSHQDTTTPDNFQLTMDRLATRDSALLATLRSPTPCVLENTALLLHLLSQHTVAEEIRESALGSGLVLEHFFKAIFSHLEGQRFLSRYLCSQWLTERLIKRMVPIGFLSYLSMPTISRVEEEQLDALERDSIEGAESQLEAGAGTNMSRLRSRMTSVGIPSKKNFRIFFHVLTQDHQMADLIWNTQTRRELRIALESELALLKREEDKKIAWNHQQFRVDYPSLEDEVQVGKVYMRLWLQTGDAFIRNWEEPVRLFEHLFRRFLCEVDRNETVTNMCIRCLERLYAIHAAKIGPFTDAMIVVKTMSSTKCIEIQHRLLMLLTSVLGVEGIPENAEQLLNVESLSQLCQFVAWGHTNGAQVGNILARALGSQTRPMLTNGSDQRPSEEVSNSSPAIAGDHECPPMWFVASTGRSPPPAELIRGPFRVSDLVQMMNRNEISQYDLVTTSHVEDYDSKGAEAELQIDTGKWKRLNQVWQLRWQLCTDGEASPLYAPSEVAVLALRALTSLVDLHPSTDSRGTPYYPIPIAKRILSGSSRSANSGDKEFIANPLPIITQALLCNDGGIIEQVANLIFKLCEHNERATSKLYLTGFFFFALGYTGSDFTLLAKLLQRTHLRQHFQSGFAATAKESELPIGERSILGSLLPAGVLHILTTYGADRFAEIFVGNADTPEVIWTFEMRKHLIEMIRQHLGDLPLRLFQHNTMEYEYCPMPGVAYNRLAKEIFCHKYYLQNLCDEERFPDWPISEPVELFRECLGKFTTKVKHDESQESENLEKARQALQLQEGDGSKELRRAYRNLARKYHPDKNPSGRDMFETIQKAYERLLPIVEGGETIRVDQSDQPGGLSSSETFVSRERKTLGLLIRTQLLVCRRFSKDMAELKYPAYSILLQCITLPEFDEETKDSNFVKSHVKDDDCSFISRAVELIFRTCLLSPMNAEGLVEEGGVCILVKLVHVYARIVQVSDTMPAAVLQKIVPMSKVADILSNAIHTLAGVAFFDSGRAALKELPNLTEFFIDLKSCLDGSLFCAQSDKSVDASLRRYAIEGIPSLAKDPDFQVALVGCGILWPLIKYTILFDPTMDNGSIPVGKEEESTTSAATINSYAKLSVRALGALAGAIEGWPSNVQIMGALNTLLTPAIVKHFRNRRTEPILTALNTNVERADMIWNVQMRDHLEGFLETIEKDRPTKACNSVEQELQGIGTFKYQVLSEEIQVGGIYIRFFNKGGSSSLSHVENLGAFFDDVLVYVGRTLNFSFQSKHRNQWEEIVFDTCDEATSESTLSSSLNADDFHAVLTAFRSLCQVDGLVEDSLKRGNKSVTSVILSLLELPLDDGCFDIAGDILSSLSSAQYFADSVVADRTFWRLSSMLENKEPDEQMDDGQNEEKVSKRKARAWTVLEALTSSPSIANEILTTTVWLELLGVIVGFQSYTKLYSSRLGSAKTLSRLLWDPSTGQLSGKKALSVNGELTPSTTESLLQKFLPPTLICLLKYDPNVMITKFDGAADTPELIWDGDMRAELRAVVCPLLDKIMNEKASSPRLNRNFLLKPETFVAYSRLHDELFIGGVYVSRYLKEPSFNLRDPAGFLELLLQRWNKELEQLTSADSSRTAVSIDTALATANKDVLEMVTTASVYICRGRDTLCDKLAEWGYMAKCVSLLEKVLLQELRGSPLLTIMRILHVASGRRKNVEALALVGHSDGRRGVVEFTIESIGKDKLHDDCAFMMDFLKKSFEVALGNVDASPSCGSTYLNPSPAPGEGPVRRKVNIGDDPLGMFQSSQGNAPSASQVSTQRQQSQGMPPPTPTPVQQPQQNTQGFAPPNSTFAGRSVATALPTMQQHQAFGNIGYQHTPQQVQQTGVYRPQNFSGASPGSTAFAQRQIPSNGPQSVGSHMKNSVTNFFRGTSQQSTGQEEAQRRPTPQQSLQGAHGHGPYQSSPAFQQHGYAGQQSPGLGHPQASPVISSTPQPFPHQPQHSHASEAQGTYQSFSHQQGPPRNMQPGTGMGSYSGAQPSFQPGMVQTQRPLGHSVDTVSSPQSQHGRPLQQHHGYQQGPSPIQEVHGSGSQGRQPNHGATTNAQFQPNNITRTQAPHPSQNQFHPASMVPSDGQFTLQTHPMQNMNHDPNQTKQSSLASHNQFPGQQQQPKKGDPPSQTQFYNGVQSSNQGFNPQFDQSEIGNQFRGQPSMQSPVGETGQDGMIRQPQAPIAVEGSNIIDARTPVDPRVSAEQQAVSLEGAPGAAHGRVALLQQALVCDICHFLVQGVLENPTLSNVRNSASAKVHAVELVKLLCKDPGYGLKFKMILEEIPAWKKYVAQDHSLLINKKEQKTDYFLTNGDARDTKLLIQE